jgi:methylphosphotriester-DNA--protein-cysteine methyltransferase
MVSQLNLGDNPFARKRALTMLIARGDIKLAGYRKGKVYGIFSCKSGKRMHAANRVFFKDEHEARASGYRPCGNCMRDEHKLWKLMHG